MKTKSTQTLVLRVFVNCIYSHSALIFVVNLVRGIRESTESSSMCRVGQHAYDNTLGTHHSWPMRTSVHVALYMLPKRHQFIRNLAGVHDGQDDPTVQVCQSVQYKVYQTTAQIEKYS